MSRLCMRPGCDRDAAARLTYDPVGCEVWLDDLAERIGRSQEICGLHAERLTVPRGWALSDRRSDEPPLFVDAAPVEPARPAATPAPRRRRRGPASHPAAQALELFDVLRRELAESEPTPEPEPEPNQEDPAEPTAESDPEPDGLPAALQATSPLLARAFAATGHQRSVLTQRGPQEPTED